MGLIYPQSQIYVDECQQVSLNHIVYILRMITDCHPFLTSYFAQHRNKELSSPFSVTFYLVSRQTKKPPAENTTCFHVFLHILIIHYEGIS